MKRKVGRPPNKTEIPPEFLPDWLTRDQASAYLGVKNVTMRAWACRGTFDLPFTRIGGSVRYSKKDLDVFLASRRNVKRTKRN